MKNIISILVFLIFFSSSINAQWTQIFNSNDPLYGIDFISPSYGWIVGDIGVILNTTDGGNNWNMQSISSTTLLAAVDFVDTLNGWIVGELGTILQTTNAGNNWIYQTASTTEMLRDVHFIDTNFGWIIGSNGTILKTTNGGTDWILQSSLVAYDFMALSFWDKNNGIVVGDWNNGSNLEGIIYITSNSGNTWTANTLGLPSILRDVCHTDSNNAFAIGDRILYTSNGGISWDNQIYNSDHALLGISFIDSINGWIVGSMALILNSLNGGTDWRIQNSGLSFQDLVNVKFLDKMNGYAISYSGEIYKTINGGYTRNLELLTPNGGENWLAGLSKYISWTSNDVYNVKLEYSTDNGTNWNIISEEYPNSELYEWIVPNVTSDSVLVRVTDSEYDLMSDVSNNVFSITQTNGIYDDQELFINYFVSQNYPNPFNPSTNIGFRIANFGFVTLKVYDVLGNEVATLVNEEKPAGTYEVEFNTSSSIRNLVSGIYFYQLKAGSFIQSKKMVYLK